MVHFFAFVLALISQSCLALEIPGACRENRVPFNTEEGGCLDLSAGVAWSLGIKRPMAWNEANAYCEALDEAGQKDWRLPEKRELQKVGSSLLASKVFEFQVLDFFWAAGSGSSLDGWTVNLSDGEPAQKERRDMARVVCVRKPPDFDLDGVPDSSDQCNATPVDTPKERFHYLGQWKGCAPGEIPLTLAQALERGTLGCKEETGYFQTRSLSCFDVRNNRFYSKKAAQDLTYAQAQRYCSGLVEGTQGTAGQWRLPSSTDLQNISGPELGARHFKFDFRGNYWTSETNSYREHLGGQGYVVYKRDVHTANQVNVSSGEAIRIVIRHDDVLLSMNINTSPISFPEAERTPHISRGTASVICVR